jgi:hypothetical protein
MAAICALTSLFPSVGATLVRIEVSARTEKHSRTTHPVASSSRCTLKTQRSSGSREATEATTSTSLCRQPSSSHAACEAREAAPQRAPRRRASSDARLTAGRARRPGMCASQGATRSAWSCRALTRVRRTPPGTARAGTVCCAPRAARVSFSFQRWTLAAHAC